MNLKSQAQAQYQYAMSHKGKAIGSALGIIAGVSYGLAGKQSNWITAGLAIGGAVGGAILGGMFDKTPNAVVVANGNGGNGAKAPVVNDTVGEETANDTAGEDGVMNAAGRIGSFGGNRAWSYPCSHGTEYYDSGDVNDPSNQTSGTFDVNKLCANRKAAAQLAGGMGGGIGSQARRTGFAAGM